MITRGHAHPGQRYRHGWIPITGFEDISDDDLFDRFAKESVKDHPDEEALHGMFEEMGHREGDTPRARHVDQLIKSGASVEDAIAEAYDLKPSDVRAEAGGLDRKPGETRDKAARRMYGEWLRLSYLDAERETRGSLLSPAGEAAGVDPATLFSGPTARARKYASEELKRYWEEHPRRTYTEFRADILGRAADKAKAAKIRAQGQGRDFGV